MMNRRIRDERIWGGWYRDRDRDRYRNRHRVSPYSAKTDANARRSFHGGLLGPRRSIILFDRFITGNPEELVLGRQDWRGIKLKNFQILSDRIRQVGLIGRFRGLNFGMLKRLDINFVKLLAGGRADILKPFVVGDKITIKGAFLILLRFLLFNLLRDNLLVCRWLRREINGGLQVLLDTIPPFTPVQITLSNGDSFEGLATLEGRLIAVLLTAHEPPQILKREGPHEEQHDQSQLAKVRGETL